MVQVKSNREIEAMRRVGKLVAKVLRQVATLVKPGVTLLELDSAAESLSRDEGAIPAFKGYQGYRHTLCTSVNEQIVHGIPSDRALKEGDIIGLDFGLILDGFYGDSAITVPVGPISEQAAELCQTTMRALYAAIDACRAGNTLKDIAAAVEGVVNPKSFGIVREFVGHGIGRKLHEDPQVPNYVAGASSFKLKPGMTICLEPMVNRGKPGMRVLSDGWTAVSADGSLSAHYEHALVITGGDAEVLTEWDGGRPYGGFLEKLAGFQL
ncbi:MAG: type I methionyl aminopeptidase [Bdellovibrionales bacterium]|nr:type I methionyl aminopeptidase [Bdellovibrionales bacterium]